MYMYIMYKEINKMTRNHKCLRCDYKWSSELERPKTCPRCKSYYWDKARSVK